MTCGREALSHSRLLLYSPAAIGYSRRGKAFAEQMAVLTTA